jgi:hypothetical protein
MRALALKLAVFFAGGVSCLALWFPLKTEPANPNHGLTDFTAAWAKEHRFGFLHGCGATPIAPKWILTAGHLQGQRIFDYKIGAHGIGSHHIVETVPHPSFPRVDLRLYRVKETIVDYSALAKKRPETNEILTVYGRGWSAPQTPMKFNGEIIGWGLYPWTNGVEGLRTGAIVKHDYDSYKESHHLNWSFADGPATAYGDSGHPVFHGTNLLGVLFAAPAHVTFRFGNTGPCTNSAYIFDDSAISSCFTPPLNTVARISALDVTRYLDWIYDTVSPPVRLSANGSTNLAGWRRWVGLDYGRVESKDAFNLQNVKAAAPEEVYRSAIYNKGPIEYAENNLMRTERYTVRLHFSKLEFPGSDQAKMKIALNGQAGGEIDLRRQPGEELHPRVIEFHEVVPTAENVISIRLTPSLPGGSAAISGLEIVLERPGSLSSRAGN